MYCLFVIASTSFFMRNKKKPIPDGMNNLSSLSKLTKREKEIVLLHMSGKNRKDIARILKLQVSTIDAHTKKIHLKTNTHDVTGVIKYGYDNNLHKE